MIDATTPGVGFEVKSLYLWTSQNGGGMNAPASVTMTGTSLAGATVTHTLTITPTGFTGNDYIHVTFPVAC